MSTVDPLPPERLLDLYRLALDEYRFEVRLGWDRTTYFLVLNSGILTVATGLLKIDSAPATYMFIALLFLLGFGTSLIGSKSIRKNHEYYRRTIVKKTFLENKIGLNEPVPGMNPSLNCAIGTTPGQADYLRILTDPEAYVAGKLRKSSIVFWIRCIFIALAIVDLIGALFSIFVMFFGRNPGGAGRSFIFPVGY